ncbi:sulfatase [Lewinellaceae bacterium SD302]|nr:sulfatase [Lewinellaceae bacterium SD302]
MKFYPVCLLLLLFACQNERQLTKEDPVLPNIVWIVAEDLSPIIPSFGDSTAETPNLDRLAARGIRFPNTFSVSGVCAPSRAAIATGMYPTSIGAHNMRNQWNTDLLAKNGLIPYEVVPPPEVRMMSTVLRKAGYYTTNNAKTDYQFKPTIVAWDENGKQAHYRHRPVPDQPFFSIFNLEITHESQVWETGKDKLRWKAGFEEVGAPNFGWQDTFGEAERPHLTVDPAKVSVPPYLVDSEITRRDIARVYSNVEIMDQQVGLLLDQLKEDGLLDNTIIFWYTDHGGPLPRQKRMVYDSGLRVPLIIAFPDNRGAGSIDSSLISFVDFAPTVFSLVGIDPPEYLQGRAWLGTYAVPARKYIHAAGDRFDEFYDHVRATRDHRFKYIRNPEPELDYYLPIAYREQMGAMQELLKARDEGVLTREQALWFRTSRPAEELFDTHTDPHELKNLADDPAYLAKLEELRGATDAWLNSTGDLGKLPEKEVLSNMWGADWEQPQTNVPFSKRTPEGLFILDCSTPGAEIGYRILPQDRGLESWRVYTEPFERIEGDTIHARADRIGYLPSALSVGF